MVDEPGTAARLATQPFRLAALFSPGLLFAGSVLVAVSLLPQWPWSTGLDYQPCGYGGIFDLALLAGLIGRP